MPDGTPRPDGAAVAALRRGATAALTLAAVLPQLGVSIVAPLLPELERLPGAGPGGGQYVVTGYVAGFAVSTVTAGRLADRFGTRRVQLFALALFVGASLGCGEAPSMPWLIAARFAQALGGCASTVLVRLVVQERYSGPRRLRTLTTLMAAVAVTPCLAPVVGGWLVEVAGQRGVFGFLAVLGVVCALSLGAAVPDVPVAGARTVGVRAVLGDYGALFRTPVFRTSAAAISLATMAHVAFMTYSPYVLQTLMRVSPARYGGLVAVTAVGAVSGALLVRTGTRTHTPRVLLRRSHTVCAAGAALLLATVLVSSTPWAVVLPMTVVMAGIGAVLPLTQADVPVAATTAAVGQGNAAGLFFCLQQLTAVAYSAVAGQWPYMNALALAVIVAVPCLLLPALARTAGRGPSERGQ